MATHLASPAGEPGWLPRRIRGGGVLLVAVRLELHRGGEAVGWLHRPADIGGCRWHWTEAGGRAVPPDVDVPVSTADVDATLAAVVAAGATDDARHGYRRR